MTENSDNKDNLVTVDNLDPWVLFQIYDLVTERWSPIYCGMSETAIRLEIDETMKKMANRPLIVYILGTMKSGVFVPATKVYRVGDVTILEDKDENRG